MKRPRNVAFQIGVWTIVVYLATGFAALRCSAQQPLDPVLSANQATSKKKQAKRKEVVADEPTPSFQIPVAPLGFAPPALFYLTERFSQVSMHFLSENKLLFTFRVPGLIARTAPASGENRAVSRHIRAVVLDLPSGDISSEALWEVHDYSPYLWSVNDGKFLLRDRNLIQMGDASLHLEPFLRFPGDVTFLELDPDSRFLIANTTELSAAAKKEDLPATAAASVSTSDHPKTQDASDPDSGKASDRDSSAGASRTEQSLLRILRMDTRTVMLFSRVNGVAHLPIDGEGYYEALRGNGLNWAVSYKNFQGSSQPIGSVLSTCYPALEVLAPKIVLASACAASGGRRLSLLRRGEEKGSHALQGDAGDKLAHGLWDVQLTDTQVWPMIDRAPHGPRFALSTLKVTHPIGPSSPLDREDIRSQWIDVFDSATGKVALSVDASPVFDAGGNFALSPSGERFAVLHDGSIQIFNLPPAPPMPAPGAAKP